MHKYKSDERCSCLITSIFFLNHEIMHKPYFVPYSELLDCIMYVRANMNFSSREGSTEQS